MIRDSAKKWLREIQAFADGKTIQRKNHLGHWKDDEDPSFNVTIEHRIKPEPREWWEVRDASTCRVLYSSILIDNAKAWVTEHYSEGVKLFKVTEVIE